MSSKNNPTLKSCKVRVGVTIGDPSGIGPAVTLKAIKKLKGLADFVVIGDKWVLEQVPGIKYQARNIKVVDLNNVSRKNFEFGKIKSEYGRASIEYLKKALELIKNKEIDCLVTAPISKEAIKRCGFKYSGHTEFLSRRTHCQDYVMMLLNKRLKFSLVTRHISIRDVPCKLKKENLAKTIIITHKYLRKLFLIDKPKIVVCGLNPHASDNGIIGKEENCILRPVINRLKKKIVNLKGPVPADVAILNAMQKKYDCVIAMYHDQALIPLKLSDNNSGVNITLGLPFIRTAPLHGTAFDIAKTPSLVRPNSMIEAIRLAIKCASNQKNV